MSPKRNCRSKTVTPPQFHVSKHVVCHFNPTLPLQQRLTLLLPGAWACRPDLIPRDPVRWRESHPEMPSLRARCAHHVVPDFILLTRSSELAGRLAFSRGITQYLAQQLLASYWQRHCLFACSTSLPAPSRAVSTWCCHSRDQPNQGLPIEARSRNKPRIHEPTRLILSCNKQRTILVRFLILIT